MRKIAILAIFSFLLAGCSSGSELVESGDSNPTEAVPTYASCDDLNLDYLGGISRTGAENTGPLPLFEWLEDDFLFDANSVLDEDGDGIACELLFLSDELRTAYETPEQSSLLETTLVATQKIDVP